MTAKPSNWNAPNIITGVRILATPVFIWMLLADGGTGGPLRWAAALFFVLAIATDAWDGHLARSRGLITDLGKLLDPIADKFLTGAALVGLSILGELPWWVTVLVLVREVGITVHRLIEARNVVLAAAWMGKIKTVAQAVAITLALLPLPALLGGWFDWVNAVAMTIAVLLTVASGIDYVVNVVRSHPNAPVPLADGDGRVDVSGAGDASRAIDLAAQRGVRLASAESLTGGMLAAKLVDAPGASAVFSGGVVSYDTALKHSLLGVDAELLRAHGPVHPDVARQMARGVRLACAVADDGGEPSPADVGVSTTGVAGPDPDPQTGQPVGTVWVGISSERGERAVELHLEGDRFEIREAAVRVAIAELLSELEGPVD